MPSPSMLRIMQGVDKAGEKIPKISSPEVRAKMTPAQRAKEVEDYENYKAPGDPLTNRQRAQAQMNMDSAIQQEANMKQAKKKLGIK